MMLRTLLILLFLTPSLLFGAAGKKDSTYRHSPRKATLLSVAVPGAGQFYNKKYWKIPIIYGGLGFTGSLLIDHLDKVELYRSSLIAIQDDDPETENQTPYPESELIQRLDDRKRWRDQAYLVMGGIYILQIIDAHVDAQLYHFDVGDDLSFTALPYIGGTARPFIGAYLRLDL